MLLDQKKLLRKELLFWIILLSVMFSFGQNKLYRKYIIEGNQLYLEGSYPLALQNFLRAYGIDSTNANINYKIGLCYLSSSFEDRNQAIFFLKKASLNPSRHYAEFEPGEKRAPQASIYYLGQAYCLNNMFNEAISSFKQYQILSKANKTDSREIDRNIENAAFAIELMQNPVALRITNLGDSINTEFPDYSPVISADDSLLLFTSRRPGSTGNEKTLDDQFYEDIYYSSRKKDGTWAPALPIGNKLNTNGDEKCLSLSADGNLLFLTKDENGGDLYFSRLEKNKWTSPVSLGSKINTRHSENGACLSPDGNTLYFSSDRPGGLGGNDIYASDRLKDGEWGAVYNLGPKINTPYDEVAPAIAADGKTFFFSSNGLKGMGGFDIFKSTKVPDSVNTWSTPVNMGYPVNSSDDDLSFSPAADGKYAYFSSIRKGGKGDRDIYQITASFNLAQLPVDTLVMEMASGALPEANNNNTAEIKTNNAVDSNQKNAAEPDKNNMEILKAEAPLKQFSPVLFEFEKFNLAEDAKNGLDEIVEYMNENNNLLLEIYGHTDSWGEENYNYTLSLWRAQTAADYIKSKGILPERIKSIAKGEKQPVAANQNPDHSDNPEGRRKNRRIEFVFQQAGETALK